MSVTPQAFHYHLQKLSALEKKTEKYLIAYSGGVDSHVLLHLCSQLKNSPAGFEQSFSAVYIDHGLSSHSKKWGKHCQHICFELDIPLTIIEVDAAPKNGQSPEASARTARYQAYGQLLDDNECLLTAQHLDDQAETLLLQLLRGSGTKGLSAMPRVKPFSKGYLCRPILDYRKLDILDYAKQHQLQWIEDESNEDERFDRNYLRQTVLPILEKRWPAAKESFAKSAEVLAESQLLLDSVAESDIQKLYYVNTEGVLEADKLLLEPTLELLSYAPENEQKTLFSYDVSIRQEYARLNNLLRHWININYLPMPSKKILEQIVHSVIYAREDAMPLVSWSRDAFHCEVRRYRDKLYLRDMSEQASIEQEQAQDVGTGQVLSLEQAVVLKNSNTCITLSATKKISTRASATKNKSGNNRFDRKKLLSRPITIRFRQGGERFRRNDEDHSHTLKHWFQEQGIPPWEREQMPLIFWGDELIQIGHFVVNFSLSTSFKKTENEGETDDLLSIHWQRNKNN